MPTEPVPSMYRFLVAEGMPSRLEVALQSGGWYALGEYFDAVEWVVWPPLQITTKAIFTVRPGADSLSCWRVTEWLDKQPGLVEGMYVYFRGYCAGSVKLADADRLRDNTSPL